MRLIICSGNPGKVAEIRALLPASAEALSLSQAGLPSDLPEEGETLEANALQKARFAHERTGLPCLSDDSGLEVRALNGRPGVRSARYAGDTKDARANMRLLLDELHGSSERHASFRTVLAWVTPEGEWLFEGAVEGVITGAMRGSGGFGYDPVFMPLGRDRTFAEMSLAEKQALSHRGLALRRWLNHLNERLSASGRP